VLAKKKILLLVFNPFINDSRVLKEVYSLQKQDYDVHIAAHCDKGLKREERVDGLTIHRFSYLDRRKTKRLFGKFKAYMVYLKQSIKFGRDFDILHCNDLNTLPVGIVVKKFFNKNIKIIYDAHEYETETNGLHGIQKIAIKKLENFFIPYVDKVITVSDTIAQEYVKLYGIQKPALVLNTPEYTKVIKKNLFREIFNINKDKTIFLYQGSLNHGRGIEVLMETFQSMENDKYILIIMGYGPMEKEIKEVAMKYDSIYLHPAVSPNVLLDYTASADYGISIIEDTCLSYKYCLPNKMFEYIMAEIPVIVSNLPEMKKIVEDYNIGIVAKYNTSKALYEAISSITQKNRTELINNIKKAKTVYNWEEQEKFLLQTYSELI